MVPIILDGENAWEYYPRSGREFLRRFYDALQNDPGMEAVTVSEAIARHKNADQLKSLVPGSWINANFNVWIGAPEDNKAWDYLYHARNFYAQAAPAPREEQRKLAFEEILIAEGSDWNWWYGPEHHSANDRDFDELYRKHLSNVYQALGGTPPDYLAQPIIGGRRPAFVSRRRAPTFIPESPATWCATSSGWARPATPPTALRLHARQAVSAGLRSMPGIDDQYVYGRLDFAGKVPEDRLRTGGQSGVMGEPRAKPRRELRLDAAVNEASTAVVEGHGGDEEKAAGWIPISRQ